MNEFMNVIGNCLVYTLLLHMYNKNLKHAFSLRIRRWNEKKTNWQPGFMRSFDCFSSERAFIRYNFRLNCPRLTSANDAKKASSMSANKCKHLALKSVQEEDWPTKARVCKQREEKLILDGHCGPTDQTCMTTYTIVSYCAGPSEGTTGIGTRRRGFLCSVTSDDFVTGLLAADILLSSSLPSHIAVGVTRRGAGARLEHVVTSDTAAPPVGVSSPVFTSCCASQISMWVTSPEHLLLLLGLDVDSTTDCRCASFILCSGRKLATCCGMSDKHQHVGQRQQHFGDKPGDKLAI